MRKEVFTMRTTKEQFVKDFATELKEGTLFISDTLTNHTIFVLSDGTYIDGEFNEFEERCTDHSQVLNEEGYTMDDLVTIEPERQTVIMPDKGLTWEQYNALNGIEDIYNNLYVIGSQRNGTEIYLLQYLLDCGASWESAQGVIMNDTWEVIEPNDYDDYETEEKEELFILNNGDIVDVW